MRATLLFAGTILAIAPAARGQLLDATPAESVDRYGEVVSGRFQVGAEVSARKGPVRDILAMVAVPLACDEQQVQIVAEDFSGSVSEVAYRDLQGGARQMLIRIPYLAHGQKARAVVTFEVATKVILPPGDDETAEYKIPRRPPRSLRKFVGVSPYIESRDRRVKAMARDVLAEAPEDATDWQKIEMLYDHVLETIAYVEGPDTSAVTTLKEGSADCHGRSALFAALCRASGVPARIVWVDKHCFAEFYLETEEGEGRWFPIESAGSRAFGEMPLGRVILQKGDNFRIPERPRDRLRYATDWLYVPPGRGQPSVKFIREAL
ncbi:MAG: transglutaminase-like domain-containing protein [Planctomycetota bacterium]